MSSSDETATSQFDEDEVARLRTAFGRITRGIDRQVSRDDLTRTQFSVLAVIANRGPIGPAEIAAVEALNPTMISRIVGKLVDAGLIERRTDPQDRRAMFCTITTTGRALHQRVRRDRAAALAASLAVLDPSETALLRAALPVLETLAGSPGGVAVRDFDLVESRSQKQLV